MAQDAWTIGRNGVGGNRLHGNIENLSNFETLGDVENTRSSARQIAPSTDSRIYDYYIFGNTQGTLNLTYPIEKINPSAKNEFSIILEPGLWDMTLFAVVKDTNVSSWSKSDILQKASLIGYSVADLRNGDSAVPFVLSTSGLSGGGKAKFQIALMDINSGSTTWSLPNSLYTAKAEIYNPISGEIINYDDGTPASQIVGFSRTVDSEPFKGSFGNDKELPPGSYMFKLYFYDNNGDEVAVWSDSILIITGRICSDTINIPNVIGKLPQKPADLTATYYKNSEDIPDHEGMYQVHFQWEDSSNNETHFELQIADISGTVTGIFDDDAWENAPLTYRRSIAKDYFSREDYVDGSMVGSTDITVWLTLGRHYGARIRACNHAGSSEWTYARLPASGVTYSDKELSYFVPDSTSTPAKTIHRGKITYRLNGGMYNISNSQFSTNDKTVYFIQNSPITSETIGVPYWDGNGYDDSIGTDDLRRPGEVFKAWSDRANDLSNTRFFTKGVPNDGYKGFENLILYAEYEDATITSDPNVVEYKFLAKWISYKTTSGTETPLTNDGAATVVLLDVSKSEGLLDLYVTIPTDVDDNTPGEQQFPAKFDKVRMVIENMQGQTIVDFTSELPDYGTQQRLNQIALSSWEQNSIYTVTITAFRATGDGASRNVRIYIKVS